MERNTFQRVQSASKAGWTLVEPVVQGRARVQPLALRAIAAQKPLIDPRHGTASPNFPPVHRAPRPGRAAKATVLAKIAAIQESGLDSPVRPSATPVYKRVIDHKEPPAKRPAVLEKAPETLPPPNAAAEVHTTATPQTPVAPSIAALLTSWGYQRTGTGDLEFILQEAYGIDARRLIESIRQKLWGEYLHTTSMQAISLEAIQNAYKTLARSRVTHPKNLFRDILHTTEEEKETLLKSGQEFITSCCVAFKLADIELFTDFKDARRSAHLFLLIAAWNAQRSMLFIEPTAQIVIYSQTGNFCAIDLAPKPLTETQAPIQWQAQVGHTLNECQIANLIHFNREAFELWKHANAKETRILEPGTKGRPAAPETSVQAFSHTASKTAAQAVTVPSQMPHAEPQSPQDEHLQLHDLASSWWDSDSLIASDSQFCIL